MNEPGFWLIPRSATAIAKHASSLEKEIRDWDKLTNDAKGLLEMAQEDKADQTTSLLEEIRASYHLILNELGKLEFFVLFSRHYDRRNAIVSFHAGAGGVEAMDWAEMLRRMIEKFCARHGFTWRVLDEHRGEIAGIKSATISIEGDYAYGWLKSESGVHRLVRISPFDAEKMRHTSFAMVEVLPELTEVDEIKIDPKDLRIDTFLSSGHGGQSVQTTYSAVRIVHLPTRITVSCQNERSQLQNKETAMKVLSAKLLQLEYQAKEKERRELRGEIVSADWGNQIRSYVLQPYKLVKDHRTSYECLEPDRVLNGELDEFVESYLKWLKK